jgi:predicted helicase
MRIPSSHRRRLNQLLDVAGSLIAQAPPATSSRYEAWATSAGQNVSPHAIRQAVAVALPWMQSWRRRQLPHLAEWLHATAPDGVAAILELIGKASLTAADDFADCCHLHLYEELLAVDQRGTRKQRGVYYTPPEMAAFIVGRVDRLLAEEFALPLGLAEAPEPHLRILDPAAGSGIFLVEVVRTIHRRLTSHWQSLGAGDEAIVARWNDYVPRSLQPRLAGWEILPPAVVSAHLGLIDVLHATGYCFESTTPLRLELRDALAPPRDEAPFSIVLGNPPYASLSTAQHGWIESLIQSPRQGYMQVDGKPLGEKKHWLHDDYVKFLRLAQWQVEQAGQGIVGLVTNHGYLQNTSFRGLRDSLVKTFSHIEVVDLHGNAKSHERSPDGSRDENVFGIAAGVAIGVFARSGEPSSATIRLSELWGSREAKLRRLAEGNLPMTHLSPALPQRSFVPQVAAIPSSYEQGWLLSEAMPVNTTAPVTARDGFVVAFTREELVERLTAFVDLSIPDAAIRERYFGNTRSSKYPSGDSRGWKLAEARRTLAADSSWRQRIVRCQYRPFDDRYVLWHPAMVDWPRPEVTRHLLARPNLSLIARRQSPPGQPANYFWATRRLALDGIIRSDNRGSESLFPIWLYDGPEPRGNFSPAFVQAMEQATGLRFVDCCESSETNSPLTPFTLAGYVYGLFWSPEYRTSYQAAICREFPRILLPDSTEQFHRVSHLGQRLLALHAEEATVDASATPIMSLTSGYPLWRDGHVWLNASTSICEISESAWNMRIGTHQVARKWLKDRRERPLSFQEVEHYRQLVGRLEQTTLLSGISLL